MRLIEAWEPYRAQSTKLKVASSVHLDEDRGTLGIEIEAPSLVGLIQSGILFAGSCVSSDEMASRLRSMFEFASSHDPSASMR